ncbi:MAG: BrnA antitoxin family protein [Oscillospiraceae bacterium]|nr:BrnA antitoxin family protein [Oscillospiraceae bacterium]
MKVYKDIDFSKNLTTEQLVMLEDVVNSPVVPDEECPELTDEQIARLAEIARTRRQQTQTKQTVAIRLSPQALTKAKSLGKGYTTILSRILETALADNEIIKQYL